MQFIAANSGRSRWDFTLRLVLDQSLRPTFAVTGGLDFGFDRPNFGHSTYLSESWHIIQWLE